MIRDAAGHATDDGNVGRRQLAGVDARGLRPVPGLAVFAPFGRDGDPGPDEPQRAAGAQDAAGTGIVTAGLVEALPDAESPRPTQRGDDHGASPLVPGPSWRVADAMDLGRADDVFDLVACQFGVMFFPDRVRPPGGAPGAGPRRDVPLQRLTSWTPTSWRPPSTHARRGLPRGPPGLRRAGPAQVRRPGPHRADVQAAGLQFKGLVRNVLVGRSPSAATWPRATASVPRCASSSRSGATWPTSFRRSRRP